MHVAPRFLFVPVSGPGGAGEYYRSLAIAAALRRRWPECAIRFVLNREAPYAAECSFPVTLLDDSPTRATAAVNACIQAETPDVVFFDSSGRMAQYRAARAVGASIVYLSSRPKTRWKGFRWGRMRLFDQHWIAQPEFLGGHLTMYQRLKLRVLGRPKVVFLDALHEPLDPAATRALQLRLGLEPGRYVVTCPGGAGNFGEGIDAAEVFLDAARRVAAQRPENIVAVVGSRLCEQPAAAQLPPNLKLIPSLPNAVLMGLIRDAAVAAINGGSLLLQSLVQHVPIVAAPIAGDQPQRIRLCAAAGCAWPVSLDATELADALRRLLEEPSSRENLSQRARQLGLRNGVEVAVGEIELLLAGGPHASR